MDSKKTIIYTDGAARGNPGPAGWGVVAFVGEKRHEFGGRADKATNNQMELTATIEALRFAKEKGIKDFEIHSDSKYVITGINEWIHNWVKNGWRTSAKKPVLNKELWVVLHELNSSLEASWHYVEGHSGHQWNDRADEIATSFADNEPVV